MEENTIQAFAVDSAYDQDSSGVINYKDPEIGLKLPVDDVIISDYDREALSRLEDIMLDYDLARDYAKEEVSPVGEIGFYYPAEVFVGESGLLYCVYDFQDEIETFNTPEEILESYLKNLTPIGIDSYPVKTHL